MKRFCAIINIFRLSYSLLLGAMIVGLAFWLALEQNVFNQESAFVLSSGFIVLSAMAAVLSSVLLAFLLYSLIGYIYGQDDLVQSAVRYKMLTNSQRRIDKIMESVGEGIFVANRNGVITEANKAAADIFAYQGDLVGCNIDEFMPEKDRGRHSEYVDRYVSTKRSRVLGTGPREMIGRKVTGDLFPIELSATGIELDDEINFIAVFRDISQRKEIEARLRESNESLERRVEERTQKIRKINESLVNARDEALAASSAKSDFLAMMSHEVRTPLNGIIGMLDLLKQSTLGRTEKEYLEIASISSHNLLQLLNNVLDMSRIESGHIEVESIDFNLKRCLEDSARLYGKVAQSKGLQFVVNGAENIPMYANGDPNRIRQVVSNMLGNAMKFTDQGKVVMDIDCHESNSDKSMKLNISVSDTGIGIPKSVIDAVGQPFFQAKNSSEKKYGGSGLGLSLCRKILAAMGGGLNIRSHEGQGTTVSIVLSLNKSAREIQPKKSTIDVSGSHILVISDYTRIFSDFYKVLGRHGAEVTLMSDPQGLMSGIASEHVVHPDVVIIDMITDDRATSMDIAERLLPYIDTARTKIIAMQTNGVKGDGEKARRLGLAGYLTKPFSVEMLLSAVSAVLHDNLNSHSGLVTKYSLTNPEKKLTDQQKHILIVEDNVVNQKIITAIMMKLGYSVDIADNGKIAVEMIGKGNTYAAILMDCQMPVMDGFVAADAIRRLENDENHVPIIAMTANALPDIKEKCITAGMDDFMTKPVDVDEIRCAVNKWIN